VIYKAANKDVTKYLTNLDIAAAADFAQKDPLRMNQPSSTSASNGQ
jgi:hypothetical protein